MNVAILTENLAFGGINRYCLDLVDGLRRYRDLRVCLLAPQNSKDKWLIEEAEKIGVTVETTSGKRVSAVNELYKLCKNIHPDILHTQGYYSNVIGRLAVRMHRMPITLVNTVHGIYHFSSAAYRSRLWYALDYLSMGLSDEIITVSKTTAQQLKWMQLQKRIVVIANGTKIHPLTSKENALRLKDQFGLPKHGKIICFVGRLDAQKGIVTLIQVMRSVIERDENALFVIVGDGEYMPALQSIAGEYPGKVFLFGKRGNVSSFYQIADLFLLTSITEGLPMALIEAFAHGLTAVATNVGGVSEVVHDKLNGLLCAPGDVAQISQEILYILHNDELRSKFSVRARKTVEEYYSFEQMVQKTYELYTSLIYKKRSNGHT